MTPRSGFNWRGLAREPLLHFLLPGWCSTGWRNTIAGRTTSTRIFITPERIAQLTSAYTAEFGAPPPPTMLPRLIDDYVAAEVLFREGRARGLDRDDEIVRRRVIQKVEFLEQDMASVPEPSEAELRAGMRAIPRVMLSRGGSLSAIVFFAAEAANDGRPCAPAPPLLLAGACPATTRAAGLGRQFPRPVRFCRVRPR